MADAIEFLEGISVDGGVTVDGSPLGSNAFNSTLIPTNNNQITNGAVVVIPLLVRILILISQMLMY